MATATELMASGLPNLLANMLGNTANIAIASTGSTQAGAAGLGGANFVVVSSGAGSTGVVLPKAMGQPIHAIINSTGNTIQVYGDAGNAEKINNIASATGVSLTNGQKIVAVPCNNAWIGVIA